MEIPYSGHNEKRFFLIDKEQNINLILYLVEKLRKYSMKNYILRIRGKLVRGRERKITWHSIPSSYVLNLVIWFSTVNFVQNVDPEIISVKGFRTVR